MSKLSFRESLVLFKFEGAELTLMDNLVQFNYSIAGHSQVQEYPVPIERLKGGNIKFDGAKCTLMDSLVMFNFTELNLKGAISISKGSN